MANNSLLFSEVLPRLTPEEEAWLRLQLEWIDVKDSEEVLDVDAQDGDEGLAGNAETTAPRFLLDYPDYDPGCGELGFECQFHDDNTPDGWKRHLWLYADDSGDPGHAAWLVQKFLKQFRQSECWALTYATTCSKPRAGEFGGGACFVTAEAIEWENAYGFVEKRREAFYQRQAEQQRRRQPQRFVAELQQRGIRPGQLDELVHEAAAAQAAAINNGGPAEQVEYLAAYLGAEELEKTLRSLAVEGPPREPAP